MPYIYLKDTRSRPRERDFFMPEFRRGGDPMNKLIARLIDCGMSREVALYVYGCYKRKGRLNEFERYVESVEAEYMEVEYL